MKVYVAHSFPHRRWVRDILCPALHAIGIETSNPFYEPDGSVAPWRPEVRIADELEAAGKNPYDCSDFTKLVKKKCDDIVETDLTLIDNVDGIVAYMTKITAGTSDEIFYKGGVSQWLAKKYPDLFKMQPVFLITDNEEMFWHPWIRYCCKLGGVFHNIDELIKHLKAKGFGK